jgi:hypothetical protein
MVSKEQNLINMINLTSTELRITYSEENINQERATLLETYLKTLLGHQGKAVLQLPNIPIEETEFVFNCLKKCLQNTARKSQEEARITWQRVQTHFNEKRLIPITTDDKPIPHLSEINENLVLLRLPAEQQNTSPAPQNIRFLRSHNASSGATKAILPTRKKNRQ